MSDLIFTPELCVDCMKCERNCPQNSMKLVDKVPLFCMHCSPEKAPCLLICPEGAIEALGGAITINNEKCTLNNVKSPECKIFKIFISIKQNGACPIFHFSLFIFN